LQNTITAEELKAKRLALGFRSRNALTGLLVPPDNPHLLAQAVLKLMNDPGLAAHMGAAGRRLVEAKFSVERMVAETTALCDDLLRQKGIRP
jgi:glycosyltransferase involved in cell wall biosynthesis